MQMWGVVSLTRCLARLAIKSHRIMNTSFPSMFPWLSANGFPDPDELFTLDVIL